MAFEKLNNTLNGADLRRALFDAQSISYRLISLKKSRNEPIKIGESMIIHNNYYNVLRVIFNDWNSDAVDEQMSYNDDLTNAVKSVVTKRNIRRVKRAKKQSSRIWREVNRMWKQGFYGRDEEIHKAIDLLHKAYRETFINVRTKLRPELYACIPDTLVISLPSRKEIVKNLYVFDDSRKAYILNKDIIYSAKDLRELQFLIAPYVFKAIHGI